MIRSGTWLALLPQGCLYSVLPTSHPVTAAISFSLLNLKTDCLI